MQLLLIVLSNSELQKLHNYASFSFTKEAISINSLTPRCVNKYGSYSHENVVYYDDQIYDL